MPQVYRIFSFTTEESPSISFTLTLGLSSDYFCNSGVTLSQPIDIRFKLELSTLELCIIYEPEADICIGSKWELIKIKPTYFPQNEIPLYLTKNYIVTTVATERDFALPSSPPTYEIDLTTLSVYKIKKERYNPEFENPLEYVTSMRFWYRSDRVSNSSELYHLVCGDRFIVVSTWQISEQSSPIAIIGDKIVYSHGALDRRYFGLTGVGIIDTATNKTVLLPEFDYSVLRQMFISDLTSYFYSKTKDVDFYFVPSINSAYEYEVFVPAYLINVSLINDDELHIYVNVSPSLNRSIQQVFYFCNAYIKTTGSINLKLNLFVSLSDNTSVISGNFDVCLKSCFIKLFLHQPFLICGGECLYRFIYKYNEFSGWQLTDKAVVFGQGFVQDRSDDLKLHWLENTPIKQAWDTSGGIGIRLRRAPNVEYATCYLWQPSFDSSRIVPKGRPIVFNTCLLDVSSIPPEYKFTIGDNTYIVYSRVSRKLVGFHDELNHNNPVNFIPSEWIEKGYPYEYVIARIDNTGIVAKTPEGFYNIESDGFVRTIPDNFLPLLKTSVKENISLVDGTLHGVGGLYFDFNLDVKYPPHIQDIIDTFYNYASENNIPLNPQYISFYYIKPDIYMMCHESDLFVLYKGTITVFEDFEDFKDLYNYPYTDTPFRFIYPLKYTKDALLLLTGRAFINIVFTEPLSYTKIPILPNDYSVCSVLGKYGYIERDLRYNPATFLYHYSGSFSYPYSYMSHSYITTHTPSGMYIQNIANNITFIYLSDITECDVSHSLVSCNFVCKVPEGHILLIDKERLFDKLLNNEPLLRIPILIEEY